MTPTKSLSELNFVIFSMSGQERASADEFNVFSVTLCLNSWLILLNYAYTGGHRNMVYNGKLTW